MEVIGDLLSRDLNQEIEEIIQVDQINEQTVYSEITEYVATKNIKDHYMVLLDAIAEAPADPHEGIGIWISGFFGSGKSSFAKNLGYALSNPQILGHSYSQLFKDQLDNKRIGELIDFINIHIPLDVVMFDISKAKEVRTGDEKIAEVIYRRLLSYLGYAEDYDIAELEIELESEGRLKDFTDLSKEIAGKDWDIARKGAKKINYASAILSRIEPEVFPQADSWARSSEEKHPTLTVELVVERAFELMSRRKPGRTLFFIIDEVGRYVANSVDRIEDLRAVVEQFGKISKNYVKAKKTIAPIWVAVTSQEKLEEIVAGLDSKRVDLAKLQDRFKRRVDLAPADIKEVASRRVLAKKPEALPVLRDLYEQSHGQLNLAIRLERTNSRNTEVGKDDFEQCYPYLPHFIDLSIYIMSGIRLQPGADRHLGGSNRTIIKQAHEMLVNERTDLKNKPIGTLVTLDKIFDLVEGNLSTEKRKDLFDIAESSKGDMEWPVRVAKAICLLEFVRDLPRTENNISACLVDGVGRPSPLADVKEALASLQEAKFIRNTEDGWKLQTAQEKGWETERRSLAPKVRDKKEIVKDALADIFSEPSLSSYRYQKLKTFKLGISYNGEKIADGQIPFSIVTSVDNSSFQEKKEEVCTESRQGPHYNEVYFTFPLNPEIDEVVADIYSSSKMIEKYDALKSQNKITIEESTLLESEKKEKSGKNARLQGMLTDAIKSGASVFRANSRDGSDLGKTVEGMVATLLDDVILYLYPRLPVWARSLDGHEAGKLLEAANLNGLPPIFYNGEQGLNLVKRDGQKYILNTEAEIVREVLDYLIKEHSYGSRDTRGGKALEAYFGGIGYGGDLDMLRLILAVLFRAGAIEVSQGGKRFDSYQDPASHDIFTNNRTFRSAVFTPATIIDFKVLKSAVLNYEAITGQTIDVDKNAISSALKQLADDELKGLIPVRSKVEANGLPGLDHIRALEGTLKRIQKGMAEECVNILVGEGKTLKESLELIRKIGEGTSGEAIGTIKNARLASKEMWPVIKERLEADDVRTKEVADGLSLALASDELYERLSEIKAAAQEISGRYSEIYSRVHSTRRDAYSSAINEIKGLPDWPKIKEDMRASVLIDLSKKACGDLALPDKSLYCTSCNSSIPQMESDIQALPEIKVKVRERIADLTKEKEQPVERVKLSRIYKGNIDSEESVEKVVEALREHLMKLLLKNAKIILE